MQIINRLKSSDFYDLRYIYIYSFTLTVSRAAILPFLAIYLSQAYEISIETLGVLLSATLIIGTISSLFGGYFVDSLSRLPLLIFLALSTAFLFGIIPSLNSIWSVAWVLIVINAILSIAAIAIKTSISEMLEPEIRIKGFSINYTIVNIGFAVGPMISVFLSLSLNGIVFYVSSGLAIIAALTILLEKSLINNLSLPSKSKNPISIFISTRALFDDKMLMLFTIGGLFSAIAYLQFSAYLSQYLILFKTPQESVEFIGLIVTVNAILIICFQFLLSKYLNKKTLFYYIVIGSTCLVAGLLGFASSTLSIVWILAMAVFTFGEIMLVPAEYLYVDQIAPDNMRGSYYAAHNLASLGGAISPAICGFLLTNMNPIWMFVFLITSAILGMVFYGIGQIELTKAGR